MPSRSILMLNISRLIFFRWQLHQVHLGAPWCDDGTERRRTPERFQACDSTGCVSDTHGNNSLFGAAYWLCEAAASNLFEA